MLGNHAELSSIKQQLNVSQTRVELALKESRDFLDVWLSDFNNDRNRIELLQSLKSLREVLNDHITRVAGEGFLEIAITLHPSLSSSLNDVEKWQESLIDSVDELINMVSNRLSDPASGEVINKQFLQLHDEIIAVEQRERHLLERGLF